MIKKCLFERGLLIKGLLLCLTPLVLASCATRMRVPVDMEPERLLPAGAMAYIRVSPVMADELILPLIGPYGISQVKDMLDRTESMVLAVMPPASTPDGRTDRPAVYGVVSGNFPSRSLALKLNTDRHWARENPGWIHKEEGFRLALTSRGQIVVGTGPLETILSAGQDRPNPVPDFWSAAWDNDLAAYIPDPIPFLGSGLPLDISALPLESMLISTRRLEGHYDLYLGFRFATERSAVVFAPLCRLFLYALAIGLWPEHSVEILASVNWSVRSAIVEASGIRMDASQLSRLLALPFGNTVKAPIGLYGASE